MADKLTTSLQESVLTLIATDDERGRIAAGLLKPEFFDETYRDIATRVLSYIKEQRKAPGKAHLDDLLDDVISDPKHKKRQQYLHILESIFANADALNSAYVLSRVNDFARLQSLKEAWFDSADLLKTGKEGATDEVEQIWNAALRSATPELDHGVFLSDRKRALEFLDRPRDAYYTGIKALDRVACGPTPGMILLFIAPKGRGKSWFAIHCGRQALMQRARVVHITLEMPEWQVTQRYFQSFFGIPKRMEEYKVTTFDMDKRLRRLSGLITENVEPSISFSSREIKSYLNKRIKDWGAQFDRLVIKGFPSASLTVQKLDAYLDMLEFERKFIPNVLIIDYPDLMHIRKGEQMRLEINRLYVELRGLLDRRKLAGIFPTQGNRLSWDATTTKASMVAEDASKNMTSDMILLYSQTKEEKEKGLARLFLSNNRGDEDGFTVLIAQNYKGGQFVIDSTRMVNEKHYWSLLPRRKQSDDETENDE